MKFRGLKIFTQLTKESTKLANKTTANDKALIYSKPEGQQQLDRKKCAWNG